MGNAILVLLLIAGAVYFIGRRAKDLPSSGGGCSCGSSGGCGTGADASCSCSGNSTCSCTGEKLPGSEE